MALFLVVTLSILTSAAILSNQTILFESNSNSTIRLEQDTTADLFNLSLAESTIKIHNLSTDANFSSINETYDASLDFYGLTDALLFWDNLTIIGETNLADNDGNINTTVPSNRSIIVMNNYNLTEGAATRNYDPLAFDSINIDGRTKTYTISSDLNNDVNISVDLIAVCKWVGKIEYFSESGNFTQTFNTGEYTCTNNRVVLNIQGIESSSTNNRIVATYNKAIQEICNQSDLTFMEAISIVGVLLTILLVGGVIGALVLAFNGTLDLDSMVRGIDLETIVGGVIIIGLTGLIIATMAFLMGGSYCPIIGA